MDARRQRGLELAATKNIRKDSGVWLVPSQSSDGTIYRVTIRSTTFSCTCPDHETRRLKCKHVHAATFVMRREQNPLEQKIVPRNAATVNTDNTLWLHKNPLTCPKTCVSIVVPVQSLSPGDSFYQSPIKKSNRND